MALQLPTSIPEAGRRLRDGSLTCATLTEAYLRSIERLQPKLNAFITITADRALEEARTLDAELRVGKYRGALHGIPIVHKDNTSVAGIPATVGSEYFRNRVPDQDSAMVRRLRDAGAISLGKANMSEFASGSSGVNVFFGNVHNPWDLKRAPGGSSSGTAAAVAAGMCLAGTGTDSGGSVRQPAARCGLVGIRPTFGRVSLAGVWPRTKTLGAGTPAAIESSATTLRSCCSWGPASFASETSSTSPSPENQATPVAPRVTSVEIPATTSPPASAESNPSPIVAPIRNPVTTMISNRTATRRIEEPWLAEIC